MFRNIFFIKVNFCVIVVFLISIASFGQRVVQCDSLRSLWVFEEGLPIFVLELNMPVLSMDQKEGIVVGSDILISQLYDKHPYLNDSAKRETNGLSEDDKDHLEGVILLEWWKKIPHPEMRDVTAKKADIEGDKLWFIFEAKLPSQKNNGAKNKDPQMEKLFQACTISGDNILSLSTIQFSDQQYEDCYSFLLQVISTYKQIHSLAGINDLCEELTK